MPSFFSSWNRDTATPRTSATTTTAASSTAAPVAISWSTPSSTPRRARAPGAAPTGPVLAALCRHVSRVAETAEELVYNVFLADLFSVGIQVGEEVRLVEGLEICGDRILPLVDGEPYDGSIDDVIFDR